MSDIFRELIDEYKSRSNVTEREQPEPANAGELFYDSSLNQLYVAGYTDEGTLSWFAV
jgi:hypothetical protein